MLACQMARSVCPADLMSRSWTTVGGPKLALFLTSRNAVAVATSARYSSSQRTRRIEVGSSRGDGGGGGGGRRRAAAAAAAAAAAGVVAVVVVVVVAE